MDKKRRTFLIAIGQTGKLHREERAEKLQAARDNVDRLRMEREARTFSRIDEPYKADPDRYCENCMTELQDKKVIYVHIDRKKKLTIKNTPARVCPNCREKYYSRETRKAIKKAIKNYTDTIDYSDI